MRRSQDDRWATNLAAARQFHAREGHLRPARKHAEHVNGESMKLGAFLDNTRKRAAKLSAERREQLAGLGLERAAQEGSVAQVSDKVAEAERRERETRQQLDSPAVDRGPYDSDPHELAEQWGGVTCRMAAHRRPDGRSGLARLQPGAGREGQYVGTGTRRTARGCPRPSYRVAEGTAGRPR
ncbi:helicase associated domain-containing protein [Streptomyces phaeochromogenes]|uniref:helicase associated domain-containing protein n=1 Tax=Streptomyces phaeochromogenes TaxID=1923 RepID=UPI0033EF359D